MCVYSSFGILVIFAFSLAICLGTSVLRNVGKIHGSWMSQSEVENITMSSIDTEDLKLWSQNYTRKSHLAGQGKDLADWTNDKFQEFGLDSEIVPYYVYLNYPGKSSLQLVDKDAGSIVFEASLKEDVLKEDPTTGNSDGVPVFHGYSANGSATAQFVYANYGRKEDFELLADLGVEVKDKIVLVRYNKIFRGLKVKHAQDLGAVGVVIFSDPTDDEGIDFAHGAKPYPKGPARNPSSVQRGSVGFLSYGPGDPTTPGYASKKNAARKDPYDLIPSIPSLPISYADAIPILKELNGKGPAPKDFDKTWGGILDGVSYNVGPSINLLSINNNQEFGIHPIHNVIGKFEGILSEQAIVVGNHRDAWISGGAGDPNSGSAVLLSLAKALGQLKQKGWRPLRTIILASWDGEEYALLGSTEWGEDNAKYLKDKVLAYINLDVAVSGSYFTAGASPSLNELLRRVTTSVPYPSGGTIYEHWKKHSNNRISTLGTGSDYTVFLDHLGIPSINFGFKPGAGDPIYHYHSNYDSFHWMNTFVDTDWKLHAAAAQIYSLLTLSLADKNEVDLAFEEYGTVLKNGLHKILEQHKVEDLPLLNSNNNNHNNHNHHDNNNNNNNRNHNNRHGNRSHCKASTTKEYLQCLQSSIDNFISAGKEFDQYSAKLIDSFNQDYPWFQYHKKLVALIKLQIRNLKVSYLERVFLVNQGLDNRPWYKHILFAPNRYLGYGGTVFPGILESLEDNDPHNFIKWSVLCSSALEAASSILKSSTKHF